MKRILPIITCLAMVLCLWGCCCPIKLPAPQKDPLPQPSADAMSTIPDTAPTETELPETEPPETTAPQYKLPFNGSIELYYGSGVGGWGTTLTLYKDGTFTGSYFDSDLDDTSAAHPYGTHYFCDFSGRFEDIIPLDTYRYSLRLAELSLDPVPAGEWIEDGVRYVASDATGIASGEYFVFYMPNTPLNTLSYEFLYFFDGDNSQILNCYGLENLADGTGFFS